MATKLTYDNTHCVAFPSKLLAQNGGSHIVNIELAEDCDNGNIVRPGEFLDLDLYAEAEASTLKAKIQKQAANGNWYVEIVENPDHECFVYMQPFIEEEWTNSFKQESRWYNAAGDVVRSYILCPYDVVEISEAGFEGTPVAGAELTVANKKFVVG